jgi:hypothetical protein
MEFALVANAVLAGACLEAADMSGAILDAAVLTRANLRLANLRGAGFHAAQLDEADLRGARLAAPQNAPVSQILTLATLGQTSTSLPHSAAPHLSVTPMTPKVGSRHSLITSSLPLPHHAQVG